jgi:hypothetical protein
MIPLAGFFSGRRRIKIPLFDGGMGTPLQSQMGVLGLCALGEAGFLTPSESRLPLSGGAGIPALGQERWDSPAGRWGLSIQAQWRALGLCALCDVGLLVPLSE